MPVETLPDIRPGHEKRTAGQDNTTSQYENLYNVVLLDDNMHTYDYVIEMLQTLLGCPAAWAFEMACEVDTMGRVILDSTTLEEAHLLQEKVHGYGADPRMPHCRGSMSAIIEPAAGA